MTSSVLWFAWKSVPLWYLKQLIILINIVETVVICLKISTFVVSKTTLLYNTLSTCKLWFAWKSVPLWYLKQQIICVSLARFVVICLKISTFVVSKTTTLLKMATRTLLWFAWKSVPLWYLKQHHSTVDYQLSVVICLKISTFVVSKTTNTERAVSW